MIRLNSRTFARLESAAFTGLYPDHGTEVAIYSVSSIGDALYVQFCLWSVERDAPGEVKTAIITHTKISISYREDWINYRV